MRISGLCLLFFLIGQCTAKAPLSIKIDVSSTFQTIDHFGASDCWSFQKIGAWDDKHKEQIIDLLFSQTKGIGLSAWRFNIGAGINKTTIQNPWRTVESFEVSEGIYDWTRQAEERWFLHAAQERGVDEFIAYINSPPARMTRNGYTNCTDKLGSTNLKPGYEEQFARYLVDILKFFRDTENITFDFISPVNEPQWEWNNGCNQEGTRAGNADIIAIVNALYDELQKQNITTQISIVESGDIPSWHQKNSSMTSKYGKTYGNYLQELIANPQISAKIARHFGGHSYWSDRLNGQLVEHRSTARPYFTPFFDQGWSYWATEYCILDGPEGKGGGGRDLSITSALDVARVIHHDLTYLDAAAWSWWTAVSPEDYKDGLIYTDYKSNPASQSIIESKMLWAYGNFSRYIRPGAKRISLSGANNKYGLMGSAYLSKAGDQLMIVFVNVASKDIQILLALDGLAMNTRIAGFTPYVTSGIPEDNLKEYAFFPLESIYAVPARSVVTLVGQITNDTRIGKSAIEQPQSATLLRSNPNPFNYTTRINVNLEHPADCELNIYNISGQLVKTLFNGLCPSGVQYIEWDATDSEGRVMSSGIFYCSLASPHFRHTIKLLLVR
jgi:hypothetical protein